MTGRGQATLAQVVGWDHGACTPNPGHSKMTDDTTSLTPQDPAQSVQVPKVKLQRSLGVGQGSPGGPLGSLWNSDRTDQPILAWGAGQGVGDPRQTLPCRKRIYQGDKRCRGSGPTHATCHPRCRRHGVSFRSAPCTPEQRAGPGTVTNHGSCLVPLHLGLIKRLPTVIEVAQKIFLN